MRCSLRRRVPPLSLRGHVVVFLGEVVSAVAFMETFPFHGQSLHVPAFLEARVTHVSYRSKGRLHISKKEEGMGERVRIRVKREKRRLGSIRDFVLVNWRGRPTEGTS